MVQCRISVEPGLPGFQDACAGQARHYDPNAA